MTQIVKLNLLSFNLNEEQATNLIEEFYGKVLKFSPPTPTKWIWEIEFSRCDILDRDEKNVVESISALDNAKGFVNVLERCFPKPEKNNKTKS